MDKEKLLNIILTLSNLNLECTSEKQYKESLTNLKHCIDLLKEEYNNESH